MWLQRFSRAATPPGVPGQGLLPRGSRAGRIPCACSSPESPLRCNHTAGQCAARTLPREPPQPKAELQEGGSAGMLTASLGLERLAARSCRKVEGIKRARSGAASALRQQDQGCCSVLLQLRGKTRQACLYSSLRGALSAHRDRRLPFVLCQP